VIVCPKCGKENQDHYKFCLGCGNELPRDTGARGFRSPTPTANPIVDVVRGSAVPGGIPPAAPVPGPFSPGDSPPPPVAFPLPPPQAYVPPPVASSPFVVPPPPSPVMSQPPVSRPPSEPTAATCPQCASPNPRQNRFCLTCGFDTGSVSQAPASAPDPTPETLPPPVAAPQVPRVAVERARLVLIRPDGTEGGHHPLLEGDSVVGRNTGGVFASDPFLSPQHASFTVGNGTVTVRDEGTLNGIYIRIEQKQPVELHDGDVFRIGQEILRFEAFLPMARQADGTERIGADVEGLVGKIVLVTGRESFSSAFPVPVTGLYLGRERGDILFPEDGYVSGLHCQIAVHQGRVTVTDVGSSNGSYVRLHGPRALRNGDFLLLGQQLFRIQTL